MLDSRISMDLGFLLNSVMNLLSVLVAGFFVSPWMILFAALLLIQDAAAELLDRVLVPNLQDRSTTAGVDDSVRSGRSGRRRCIL